MGKQYQALDDALIAFIGDQHMFFTASAAPGARINVSPRSTSAFRVLDPNTAVYLDRTGSGNETAAHLAADGRLTIMFCAMEGAPRILRLYGRGEVVRKHSDAYNTILKTAFDGHEPPGARQMIRLSFDLVQTSCGFGVPLFQYEGERDILGPWAAKQGAEGIEAFQRKKNTRSLDDLPTYLFEPSPTEQAAE